LAVYALGDLSPGFFERCEWFCSPAGERAIVLIYRAFETPVLFALGEPDAVEAILDEVGHEPKFYLSIRPEILPLIKARYEIAHERPMWRMILAPSRERLWRHGARRHLRPSGLGGAVRLGQTDVPALEELYADGKATGESPDFFSPEMVANGVFYGIWEGKVLVSAAGTHIIVPAERVCAIGNVYTRRDRRGRGLGRQVTSAVAAEALRMGARTVALNVAQANLSAIRVYERIGFHRYCPFYEGIAIDKSGER
jgi:ribosomal protein S18 acetylase RimI-like enzyme